MGKRDYLGEFELMVMLPLIRLGENAYGVPISGEIELNVGAKLRWQRVFHIGTVGTPEIRYQFVRRTFVARLE